LLPFQQTGKITSSRWLLEETYAQTRKALDESMSLPPDVYYSSEYFDAEKQQVFGKSWVCVGYTQQLERPGGMYNVCPCPQVLVYIASHRPESGLQVNNRHNRRGQSDTFPTSVAGQPIVVTRTKQGDIRAFYNVCRHRGSIIVTKEGQYPVLLCPYHRCARGDVRMTPLGRK
jgi:choline monooxygenase